MSQRGIPGEMVGFAASLFLLPLCTSDVNCPTRLCKQSLAAYISTAHKEKFLCNFWKNKTQEILFRVERKKERKRRSALLILVKHPAVKMQDVDITAQVVANGYI